MGTYVTDIGFEKLTLQDVKANLEAQFKLVFGSDIDLDSDQPFGQLIGILAKNAADGWDGAEEIYSSRNPKEATGTSLDYIALENALERNPATPTKVSEVLLKGDDGITILAGKIAKKPDGNTNYTLDDSITLDSTSCRFASIVVDDVADVFTYEVTIDGTTYQYESDGTATETEIINGLVSVIALGVFVGTVEANLIDMLIELSSSNSFSVVVGSKLVIEEVGAMGTFTADVNGPNYLASETLTSIVTPVTGWNSVLNTEAGVTGRNVESDSDFRLRREQSINGIGNATEEAIKAKIYDEVSGVTGVNVYSNRSLVTDSEDREPKSFEAVVKGGDDLEIAQKIWEVMPAGILSTGNINADGGTSSTIPGTGINIVDSQGYTQNIVFSRPQPIYIWVHVDKSLYDEEVYPSNGDDLIAQAIVDWSLDTNNIDVGKDVIRQRLSIPIYTVPGIEDIDVYLSYSTDSGGTPGTPPTPAFAFINVDVSDRQIADFAISRVTVGAL